MSTTTNNIYIYIYIYSTNTIITGSIDKTMKGRDLETQECTLTLHGYYVNRILPHSSGYIAIGSRDNDCSVRIWNIHNYNKGDNNTQNTQNTQNTDHK